MSLLPFLDIAVYRAAFSRLVLVVEADIVYSV